MTLFSLMQEGKRILEEGGIPEPKEEAKALYLGLFSESLTDFLKNQQNEVHPEREQLFREGLLKRKAHVPLQLITGMAPFYGEQFYVNGEVLIPRFDTEILVDWVLEDYADGPYRVLDLCTGSGCIGLTVKKNRPGFSVTCTDLSEKALQVAKINGQRLKVQADFLQGDLLEPVTGKFDLLLSNPPYIENREIPLLEEEVKNYDPFMALSGGEDGLDFYRRIAQKAGSCLKDSGVLYLEIGESQGRAVLDLFRAQGFSKGQIRQDFSGLDRVVKISR